MDHNRMTTPELMKMVDQIFQKFGRPSQSIGLKQLSKMVGLRLKEELGNPDLIFETEPVVHEDGVVIKLYFVEEGVRAGRYLEFYRGTDSACYFCAVDPYPTVVNKNGS